MNRREGFLKLYLEHRVRDQRRFYQERRREFQSAQQQGNLISGAFLMGAAAVSVFAAAGAAPRWLWAVLAVALPAIAGLGQAMQRLYAYERLIKLYDDAVHTLGDVGREPEFRGKDEPQADQVLDEYVQRVEGVFAREQSQWGQLTAELKLEGHRRSREE